ncbi:hypothetical protein Atai01_46320 [Amycolatopsis taiwanensis]|uniref:Uncharacterized protein n=2 Tax=Amycolatopsis taiwanensis TaxID=342230 RepID=A0A9W6R2D0_9PSEU|nr:hypothetical protein Atai01_46320 [Amycolatopsis taiwanensis]
MADSEDSSEHRIVVERLLVYYLYRASTWCKCLDGSINDAVPEVEHTPEYIRKVDSTEAAIDALNAEYSNLLAVARFAIEHDWHKYACQLPCSLQPLLGLRNNDGRGSHSLFQGADASTTGKFEHGRAFAMLGLTGVHRSLGRLNFASREKIRRRSGLAA